MFKIALLVALLAGTTALVAQDAEMTEAQQAAKCEAEGGCELFTQKEFLELMLEQFLLGLSMGADSCAKST